MRDFIYQNTTRIVFGKGQITALRELVPAGANVLMVAGGGSIKSNGVYEQVRDALVGRNVVEHWGIEPNPDISKILPAVEIVSRSSLTFLLAVGGGSVVDATKCLALLARNPKSIDNLFKRSEKFTDALPLGVVLTAPGTGSEANAFAAISNRETKQKIVISTPLIQPQFAVLDPEATYTLPSKQVALGVVDTYVHVLEQYITFPVGGLLSDRIAEGILLTLRDCGKKTLNEPYDYEARANWMWCASLALGGLVGLGVPQDWSTHQIGHELTALYGIDHASTLAAILPAVLFARRNAKSAKLIQYGSRVLGIDEGTEDERSIRAIVETQAFFESLGVSTRLSAYGLNEEAIAPVISNLKAARRIRLGERLDMTLEQVAGIIKSAL
jgi:NADP-dependent alcohol dehydrogenase